MKTTAFSDALTYLDDDLVSEVRTKRSASRTAWMGWAAAAACLALVIYAGVHLRPAPSAVTPVTPGQEAVEPTTPGERALVVSTRAPLDDANLCTKAPEPGECVYSLGVQAALEEHRGYGVAYLLAIQLTKLEDGILMPATEEEAAAEYRRLAEAGVVLFETPVWIYEGSEGAHVPQTVVTAMVTAEELAEFPVSADYGYAFCFPCNGDSSRPENVPGDALVLPDW